MYTVQSTIKVMSMETARTNTAVYSAERRLMRENLAPGENPPGPGCIFQEHAPLARKTRGGGLHRRLALRMHAFLASRFPAEAREVATGNRRLCRGFGPRLLLAGGRRFPFGGFAHRFTH